MRFTLGFSPNLFVNPQKGDKWEVPNFFSPQGGWPLRAPFKGARRIVPFKKAQGTILGPHRRDAPQEERG